MTTARARAENRNLLTPYRKVTGKKTTTVVRVAASTARLTSAPPCFGGDLGRRAHFQVAVDVFERDDRVVDDAREGQRQPAQDHRVDGAAHQVEHHEGGQRRKRNGEKHGRRWRAGCPERSESSGW